MGDMRIYEMYQCGMNSEVPVEEVHVAIRNSFELGVYDFDEIFDRSCVKTGKNFLTSGP